jgi:hypothetical protein
MAHLPGEQHWGKLGVWASCHLCTIVSWSAVGCGTPERFRELLPPDLRGVFVLNTGRGGLDVRNQFYIDRAQPATDAWRLLELLLVDHAATLRVRLEAPGQPQASVVISAGPAYDVAQGTPESRVRTLLGM